MDRKEGAAVSLSRASWLTQCGLGRDLLPYQVASSSIQPFGHNRHEPKAEGCAPFRVLWGAPTPSNITSPEPMFISVPSGILNNPAVGRNRHGQKLDGAVPFFLGGAGSSSNTVAWVEAYLHTKRHLSQSSRLAQWTLAEN